MQIYACIHLHTTVTLCGVGGRRIFKKFIAAENVLLCHKNSWKDLKSIKSPKMYICMEYQSILYKNKNSACLKKSTIRLTFQARYDVYGRPLIIAS